MGLATERQAEELARVAGHLREAEQALTMQTEVFLLLNHVDGLDGDRLMGKVCERLIQVAIELGNVAYLQCRRAEREDADDIPF